MNENKNYDVNDLFVLLMEFNFTDKMLSNFQTIKNGLHGRLLDQLVRWIDGIGVEENMRMYINIYI